MVMKRHIRYKGIPQDSLFVAFYFGRTKKTPVFFSSGERVVFFNLKNNVATLPNVVCWLLAWGIENWWACYFICTTLCCKVDGINAECDFWL